MNYQAPKTANKETMINPPDTDCLEEIPTIPMTLTMIALQAEDLQEGACREEDHPSAHPVTWIHGDLGCLGDHMPHQEDPQEDPLGAGRPVITPSHIDSP